MADKPKQTQKGYVFKIQKYCIHDGPGIRTTIFFQGCPLKCQWCHNPESQSFEYKLIQTDLYSVNTLADEIEKDIVFYEQSKGGVTFSGGEPLSQPDFLFALICEYAKRGIHTCLDTSGYASLDILEKICQKIDMLLFDIKLVNSTMHKKYTNVSFDTVLENLKFLSRKSTVVKIRIPLIPEITDTDNNIDDIISLLLKLKTFRDISLLPFHNTGERKYKTLGIQNHLKGLKPCSQKKTNLIKEKFLKNGFNVTIGG